MKKNVYMLRKSVIDYLDDVDAWFDDVKWGAACNSETLISYHTECIANCDMEDGEYAEVSQRVRRNLIEFILNEYIKGGWEIKPDECVQIRDSLSTLFEQNPSVVEYEKRCYKSLYQIMQEIKDFGIEHANCVVNDVTDETVYVVIEMRGYR